MMLFWEQRHEKEVRMLLTAGSGIEAGEKKRLTRSEIRNAPPPPLFPTQKMAI